MPGCIPAEGHGKVCAAGAPASTPTKCSKVAGGGNSDTGPGPSRPAPAPKLSLEHRGMLPALGVRGGAHNHLPPRRILAGLAGQGHRVALSVAPLWRIQDRQRCLPEKVAMGGRAAAA